MKWIIPMLGVAVTLQSTVLATWIRPGVVPDLALILVVLYGGLRGWRRGLAAGLVAAGFVSLVSAAPFGVHVFRLVALGVGAGIVGAGFERTSPLVPPALVALATVTAMPLETLALQAAGWVVALNGFMAGERLLQAALNAGLALAVLPMLRRVLAESGHFQEVLT